MGLPEYYYNLGAAGAAKFWLGAKQCHSSRWAALILVESLLANTYGSGNRDF